MRKAHADPKIVRKLARPNPHSLIVYFRALWGISMSVRSCSDDQQVFL